MKNIIISTLALLLSFTSYSVAEEFNENLLYTGTINSAYTVSYTHLRAHET